MIQDCSQPSLPDWQELGLLLATIDDLTLQAKSLARSQGLTLHEFVKLSFCQEFLIKQQLLPTIAGEVAAVQLGVQDWQNLILFSIVSALKPDSRSIDLLKKLQKTYQDKILVPHKIVLEEIFLALRQQKQSQPST